MEKINAKIKHKNEEKIEQILLECRWKSVVNERCEKRLPKIENRCQKF